VYGGTGSVALRRGPAVELAAGAALALVLALWAPLPLAVFGLVLLGPAHTVFELRYVIERFRPLLAGSFLVPVTVVALARLLGPSARRVEVVAAFALLAMAIARRPGRRTAVAAAVAVACAASLRWPAWYGLVLLHLHNLVPVAFLWEWSRERMVRMAAVVALLVVPLAIVAGALDSLVLGAHVGNGIGPGWAAAATQVTPPGWSTAGAARFFTAFAYLQTVHYVVWCWVLPRRERTGAVPGLPAAVVAATAFIAAVFAVDYATGRSLYSSLATYHAYLEFPVLLAFLVRRPA
jgi:hypothetical protein